MVAVGNDLQETMTTHQWSGCTFGTRFLDEIRLSRLLSGPLVLTADRIVAQKRNDFTRRPVLSRQDFTCVSVREQNSNFKLSMITSSVGTIGPSFLEVQTKAETQCISRPLQ